MPGSFHNLPRPCHGAWENVLYTSRIIKEDYPRIGANHVVRTILAGHQGASAHGLELLFLRCTLLVKINRTCNGAEAIALRMLQPHDVKQMSSGPCAAITSPLTASIDAHASSLDHGITHVLTT